MMYSKERYMENLPFFLILLQTTMFNNDIWKRSSTHRQFITKLMLITVQNFTTTQRLHCYKFTLAATG